jgi:hypothetical protein
LVEIRVVEPFELALDLPDPLVGTVISEEGALSRLDVRLSESIIRGGGVHDQVELSPRYAGDSFDQVGGGDEMVVAGYFVGEGVDRIPFLGSVKAMEHDS